MIDMFLDIGFELVGQEDNEYGYLREYKYYPSYMEDNHYRLVLFTYVNFSMKRYQSNEFDCQIRDSDWRLYMHRNSDDGFVDSLFQLSDYSDFNKVLIKKYFDRIFSIEIRDKKLEELGI
jgi:hypothetical protein